VAAVVGIADSAAPNGDGSLMRHELTTLPSGLRVATERMPGVRSVAIGAWVGVGSRDEPAPIAGISHFIEHLLFRGTARHSALEIAQMFDRFGAELNAGTARETTSIYARVIDDHLPEAMDVVGGMVSSPSWDDLEQEREVVLEEIAMLEDTPDELVFDLIGETTFPGQALGRPIIGTTDVIERLARDDVAEHHAAYYEPGNIVVAAAGAVDHARFVDLVARWPMRERASQPSREPASPAAGERAFTERDTEQYHVCLAAPGLTRHDERRFGLALLDQMLGSGASSRLFQEIRERRGMAYAVYSYTAHYGDSGVVGIYLGTRGENVAECLEVVGREIGELAAGRFDEDELQRAKDSMTGRLALAMESTGARMNRLGKAFVTNGELLDEAEVAERVARVTADDIAALAAELYDPAALCAAGIGPDREVFDGGVDTLAGAGLTP
jgi:predicted Zn-dependent peptidase